MSDRTQKAREAAAANAGTRARGIELLRIAGMSVDDIAIVVRSTPKAIREVHRRNDRAQTAMSERPHPDFWEQATSAPWND